MRAKLINKERNEYKFTLSKNEAIHRIYECLKPNNKKLKENDIYRDKNTKEYRAHFINEYGEEVNMSVGMGNLKRYFGSRLLGLNDETGGLYFYRQLPKTYLTNPQ